MPNIAAIRPVRALARGSALIALLAIAITLPVEGAGTHRGAAGRPGHAGPASHSWGNDPPLDSRDEALALGGREATGDRRTVLREGIDVSHWQGRIDWEQVAAAGVDFAIAKATEGTWMVDPWYARNKWRARKAGIAFTAYHYANPSRGREDPIREADFFLRHADLKGRHLLPALDLEETGGLSPRELQRWTLRWMRRVEKRLDVKPMLYSSPGFWTGRMENTRAIARNGFKVLWIAHWETRRPSVPASRWDGEGWTFWQWTETGHVQGVRNRVDRNLYVGPRLRHVTIASLRGRDRGGDDDRRDRQRRPRPR